MYCNLALFDILGFKQIIESQPLDKAIKSLGNLEQIVNDLLCREGKGSPNRLEVRWFQDTLIIISAGDKNQQLSSLIQYCSTLLASTFSEGIFLRGAVTHGEVYITPTAALGKPIIDAYVMEQNQDWIGCWVDLECIKAASRETKHWLAESIIILPYPVPFKNGALRSEFVLNWPLCLISESGLKALQQGWDRLVAGVHPSWEILRKIRNTDAFLQFLVAHKWKPQPESHSSASMVKPQWLADHKLYSLLEDYRTANPAFPAPKDKKEPD